MMTRENEKKTKGESTYQFHFEYGEVRREEFLWAYYSVSPRGWIEAIAAKN